MNPSPAVPAWSASAIPGRQINAVVVRGGTNTLDGIYQATVILRRKIPDGTACTATPDLKGFSCR